MTITRRASSPKPALDHASHRDLVAAQQIGDPGQDAGAVGDLEVEVEG